METSVPIASDSFSYSWLSNCNKSPLDGLEEPLRKSSYSSHECKNFNFDTSITHSPAVLVHADEIFSDGILRPVFVGPSKLESCNTTPYLTQTKLGSSPLCCRTVSPRTVEIHHGFLKRWRRSTWRTLVYFFRYVNRLGQKVGCSRKGTRVDDWQVRSLSSSLQASPKPITTPPIGDLHDHENSIYEAVLHCKRSVGIVMLFFFFSFLNFFLVFTVALSFSTVAIKRHSQQLPSLQFKPWSSH